MAYRLLAHIPVPMGNASTFQEAVANLLNKSDFSSFLNLISGGGLASFSIILVGLSPYITGSIIIQLLTKAIPSLEELSQDGETGRRKINQWTRMLTIPLAIVQSIAYIFILYQSTVANGVGTFEPTMGDWILSVTAMTAGSVILMWLGELITEQGIGNGISMIIFASIISQLPT
ncbi:preprotein translocase subunit SecY, partial [Ralstonia pseudosolanacearum]|uniref:preprotein translocase subunit SecY n=1 Tax=Ralstonia pseudosolanacearum TaxID=1310165 RepID=UPI003D1870D9